MTTLREKLADLCHRQWSGWMVYIFSKGKFNEDGSWTMPAWAADRWRLQMEMPYEQLTVPEQNSDRNEADKFLAVIEGHGIEQITRYLIGRAGVGLIAAERLRQEHQEGWTPEHDDEHKQGQLTIAAACYLMAHDSTFTRKAWPWDLKWWKPKTYEQNLVRAGALIAAELDRLHRERLAAAAQTPSEPSSLP